MRELTPKRMTTPVTTRRPAKRQKSKAKRTTRPAVLKLSRPISGHRKRQPDNSKRGKEDENQHCTTRFGWNIHRPGLRNHEPCKTRVGEGGRIDIRRRRTMQTHRIIVEGLAHGISRNRRRKSSRDGHLPLRTPYSDRHPRK